MPESTGSNGGLSRRRLLQAAGVAGVAAGIAATGGTAQAKIKLVEQAGGIVAGLAFIIELTALGGRDRLAGYDVFSLLSYEV